MKKQIALIIIILLFFINTISVSADMWIEVEPFEIWSEDGKYVFKFEPYPENIHLNFAKAAVYQKNEESLELLYMVENFRSFAYKGQFFFSNDFRNFFLRTNPDFDVALEFYSNGVLMKTYYINDLVKDTDKIPRSSSTAWWVGAYGIEYSQENNIFEVATFDAVIYTFDITNGEIISIYDTLLKYAVNENTYTLNITSDEKIIISDSPSKYVVFITLGISTVGCALVIIAIVTKKRRNT